jgi:hypothetical protein
MRYSTGCTLFGLGAATTLSILVAALEVSDAAIQATRGVNPASIDRTFKGDRGPALPGSSRIVPPAQQVPHPKLPDGCLAEVEWRSNIYSDEVPGRCVG